MFIEPVDPDTPEVKVMIDALDDFQGELYPAESNHLDNLDTLKKDNVVMLGVKNDDTLMGIGAVKFMDGYAEIKRMFIPPDHRKKGLGKIILEHLEHAAMARGLNCIRLETGVYQDPAIALYEAAGFYKISNFADYQDDPLSVFMEKELPELNDSIAISFYTHDDRDQVVSLWRKCELTKPWNDPDKDIQRKMADSSDLFFVARLNTQVIGTCMAGYDGHRGWFYYLGVSPEFQNKGIAKQLVTYAEKSLLDKGCPKINLMVRKTNATANGFYKAIGYQDDPVVVLSKRLIPD